MEKFSKIILVGMHRLGFIFAAFYVWQYIRTTPGCVLPDRSKNAAYADAFSYGDPAHLSDGAMPFALLDSQSLIAGSILFTGYMGRAIVGPYACGRSRVISLPSDVIALIWGLSKGFSYSCVAAGI